MDKPKAKKIDWNKKDGWSKHEQVGYNQACNDLNAWLPDEAEILKTLIKNYKEDINKESFEGMTIFMEKYFLPDLAEVLARRLK